MNWAWPRMRDAVPQQCNLGTKLYANMMIHPFFLFLGKRTRPRSHDDTRAGGYQETIAFKYVYIRFGCSFVSSLHPILITLRVCAVPLHASLVFTSKIVRIKAGYEKCLLLTFDPCEHPKMQSTSAHDFAIDCGPRIDPGASWPKHLNPPHPPTTQIPMVQSHFYLNQGSFQRPRHAQDFPVARWASWWRMRIMSLGPISVDC